MFGVKSLSRIPSSQSLIPAVLLSGTKDIFTMPTVQHRRHLQLLNTISRGDITNSSMTNTLAYLIRPQQQ